MRDMPHLAANHPFECMHADPDRSELTRARRVKLKRMELSYGIDKVFAEIPHLHHGSDGLIFTNVQSGYVAGTDSTLYVRRGSRFPHS